MSEITHYSKESIALAVTDSIQFIRCPITLLASMKKVNYPNAPQYHHAMNSMGCLYSCCTQVTGIVSSTNLLRQGEF